MILAYHSIFGMYGFWLPNDPRGFGSDYVASWDIFRLQQQQLWDGDRPLWGAHGWNVYRESVAAVERAIRYVNENPLKEGKKRQDWPFVVPFVARDAIRIAISAEATRAAQPQRRIGGAALKSREEARRKRRGER
jgi:hypothetical protein